MNVTCANLGVETIDMDEFEKVRNSCQKLREFDIYPFQTECSNEELLEQIAEFIQKGLEE